MKIEMKLWSVIVLGVGLCCLCAGAENKPELKTDKDKLSYTVGMNVGSSLKRQSVEVDANLILQGLKDALAGNPALTEAEAREVMTAFQKEQRAKAEAKNKELAEKNQKEGEAYRAENAKKTGVITLPSGLQYRVITEGTGAVPKATDRVSCHYRGTLIDGTEFDSSYKKGQPYDTAVTGGVIKGWTEALQLMKVASKWQLVIPPALAYGEGGRRPNIPPSATLVFELELLGINPPATNAPPARQPVVSDIIRVPSAEEIKAGAKPEVIKQPPLPPLPTVEKK